MSSRFLSAPVSAWRAFLGRRGPANAAAVVATAAALAGLVIFLLAGDKPWGGEIAKRLAAGRELKLEHLVTIGLWRGAAAGAALCALALAAWRWWSLPQAPVFPEAENPAPAGTSQRGRRWIWVFAGITALLAAWPRSARLDHSLWNDEEVHLRNYVWGAYEPGEDGALRFKPVDWRHALFYNKKGNNHQWASVECRLGHLLTGGNWGPESVFRERHLRLFPWLSGILTCGAVVLLGAAMGNPRAGLAAGLMLALHPWHARWSVEIRGYSTMMFAMTAGLLCLLRALQSNRWRWWAGFAACQAVFLLCFAGSLYVAAAQNLVALAVIWKSPAAFPARRQAAARLALAGVWSAVPVALLTGPTIPQLLAYLKLPHGYSLMDKWWYADLWAHLTTGLRLNGDPPGASNGLGVNDLVAATPWRGWMVKFALPALFVSGVYFLLKSGWRARLVAGAVLLGGGMALAHNTLSHSPMMTWYVVYLTIPFVLALAWAAAELGRFYPRAARSLPPLMAVVFALFTSPALAKIMSVPRQPIRETVQATRGVSPALKGADDKILTASFGAGARQMLSYDPRLRVLKTPEEMDRLEEQAIAENRPLYLTLRGREGLKTEEPELTAALERDPRWRLVERVLGMEEMLSYEIYEFSPDVAADPGNVIRIR